MIPGPRLGPVAVGESRPRSALTATGGFLRTFTHTLNPYFGCAFGCAFCYVRRSPAVLKIASPWGRYVNVKRGFDRLLEDELEAIEGRNGLGKLRVFMSSVTDPYQPVEAKTRISRRCLEAFARSPPQVLVVQTRSPLVLRDADLLTKLGRRVWVSFTVETDDERVRRAVTPATPPLSARFDAMRALLAAGVRVQAAVSPLLPHDPERFADLLDGACTRVVVDTFVSGDGAGGRRTERTGIPEIYRALGYGSWDDEAPARALHERLRSGLGPDRVVWSEDGFNAV